ncbi:MAG: hypothetical protein JST00_33245 [Deltaproteobacteria bacterium]|nr:hypothetical protein [Deltaproteobacteria bacterium]
MSRAALLRRAPFALAAIAVASVAVAIATHEPPEPVRFEMKGDEVVIHGARVRFSFDRETPPGDREAYVGPIRLDAPRIVRATQGGRWGTRSAIASFVAVPTTSTIHVDPELAAVARTGLYVTGPFRQWSTARDESVRVDPVTLSARIPSDRPPRVYKLYEPRADGTPVWHLDASQPRGQGSDAQNNVVDPRAHGYLEGSRVFEEFDVGVELDEMPPRIKVHARAANVDKVDVLVDGQLHATTPRTGGGGLRHYDVVLPAVPERGVVLRLMQRSTQAFLGADGLCATSAKCAPIPMPASRLRPVPEWARGTTWYQILVDRFRNGDPSNDVRATLDPSFFRGPLARRSRPPTPWAADFFARTDEEEALFQELAVHFSPTVPAPIVEAAVLRSRRYGGDLQGVRERIPYLRDLGVGGVYLMPIQVSASAHKYDTEDYLHVSPDLAVPLDDAERTAIAEEDLLRPETWSWTRSDRLFFDLVHDLHANGMKIIIDVALNHSSATNRFLDDIARRGRDSRFAHFYDGAFTGDALHASKPCSLVTYFPNGATHPHAGDLRYVGWFSLCELPEFGEGHGASVVHPDLFSFFRHMLDRWLRGPSGSEGVDGFRLDAFGDVDPKLWAQLTEYAHERAPRALMVSEEWAEGEYLSKGVVDTKTNYDVRTFAEAWFVPLGGGRIVPSRARDFWKDVVFRTRRASLHAAFSVLGSHDTDRIASRTIRENRERADGEPLTRGWDDARRNKPDFGADYVSDRPAPTHLAEALVAYQMAMIGSPVVYYGDEIGMWGADDPSNRKPMVWSDTAVAQVESRCVPSKQRYCERRPETAPVSPREDVRALYKRLLAARRRSAALREGEIDFDVAYGLTGAAAHRVGAPGTDGEAIWGFERRSKDDLAYYVSNMAPEERVLALRTNWRPGTRVREVITERELVAAADGAIVVTVPSEGAALLVPIAP